MKRMRPGMSSCAFYQAHQCQISELDARDFDLFCVRVGDIDGVRITIEANGRRTISLEKPVMAKGHIGEKKESTL